MPIEKRAKPKGRAVICSAGDDGSKEDEVETTVKQDRGGGCAWVCRKPRICIRAAWEFSGHAPLPRIRSSICTERSGAEKRRTAGKVKKRTNNKILLPLSMAEPTITSNMNNPSEAQVFKLKGCSRQDNSHCVGRKMSVKMTHVIRLSFSPIIIIISCKRRLLQAENVKKRSISELMYVVE